MKKQLCYHHKSSFMVTLIFDVCALPNSIPFKNIIKIFKPMKEVKQIYQRMAPIAVNSKKYCCRSKYVSLNKSTSIVNQRLPSKIGLHEKEARFFGSPLTVTDNRTKICH